MCLWDIRKISNVTHVDKRELPLKCWKNYVHCPLKILWSYCISQSKRHRNERIRLLCDASAVYHPRQFQLASSRCSRPVLRRPYRLSMSTFTLSFAEWNWYRAQWLCGILCSQHRIAVGHSFMVQRQLEMFIRFELVWWLSARASWRFHFFRSHTVWVTTDMR